MILVFLVTCLIILIMNRLLLSLLFILSGVLIECTNDHSPGIYINIKTGDDRNSGTLKKPLKTITEVNKRIKIQRADIFFSGDQVFEGTLILYDFQGFGSVPFIIGTYGEGRAMINGGDRESVRIESSKNFRIENLDLKGSGRKGGNTTNGLHLQNSSNFIIENIYAEGFQKSGVDLYNCRNSEVRNVTAYGNGFCGINVMGSVQDSSKNILIKDCKAENNAGDPAKLDNHSGNGILVGMSDSVTIDHCVATNNGWDMPRQGNGPVGIWAWMSNHVTIQYCISFRNKTSEGGKDGGGFDLDGGVTNSLIQYCLSYENHGAGYGLFQYPGASGWSDNVIRYCVSINDANTTEGSGSFFIWNGSDDSKQLANCYIYNNVAYSTSAPVISFEKASLHENFVFLNNIFLGSDQIISGKNTGSRFMGNVWWPAEGRIIFEGYKSLAEWAEATGQEKLNGRIAGIQSDPGLKGPFFTDITDPYQLHKLTGYTLKPGSPLRDRGIDPGYFNITDLPESDFFGNPVPRGSAPEPGINELMQDK